MVVCDLATVGRKIWYVVFELLLTYVVSDIKIQVSTFTTTVLDQSLNKVMVTREGNLWDQLILVNHGV